MERSADTGSVRGGKIHWDGQLSSRPHRPATSEMVRAILKDRPRS
jgi:hypothetical protein